jgi:hypothetical protein
VIYSREQNVKYLIMYKMYMTNIPLIVGPRHRQYIHRLTNT